MLFRGKKTDKAEKKDWVDEASDWIERIIDQVRDKAVLPLTTVARAIVYGLLAAMVGLAALVIVAILLVRLLDIYLDNVPGFSSGVWVADLVAGAIFVLAGLFLWSKRTAKNREG